LTVTVRDLDHLLFMGADEKQADDRQWLVEQRYRAVLEMLDGSPISEVAVRYGVSRQSVYFWKARHAAAGVDGLREVSRRPRTSPSRLAAETEALVCDPPGASAVGRPADRVRGGAAGRGGRAVAGDGAPGAGPQRDGDTSGPGA
jgi:transposase-like protein